MSITQRLTYVKSTKGSHVYANEHFSALYVPKYLIPQPNPLLSKEEYPPKHITITLEGEKKEKNNVEG